MAFQQGPVTKQFVSAIQFLDQRDINPNLIDVTRDKHFINIMKLIGRTKETKVPLYNYFTNNDIFADSTVSSVSSGNGTAIITIVLTAATSGYARIGDLAILSNANNLQSGIRQVAWVIAVTAASAGDTVKLQSVANNPLYAVANDTMSWVSGAYGEGSGQPANLKVGVTRYLNFVQLFKETDVITDIQKASMVEISINGQFYYLPYTKIQKAILLEGRMSGAMIAGQQSVTQFSDLNPILVDPNGNPAQTTMGMNQYIVTYGANTSVGTLGTLALTDLDALTDAFLANKAPNQQMAWCGSKARGPWDVYFKNLGSAGVTSVRMVIDGKEVNMMVDRVSYRNFTYELIDLPIFDHPQLFPYSVTPDIVGSMYFVPKDKVEVVGGGMEGRIQLRYLPPPQLGANSYSNGLVREWMTGALAPVPTDGNAVLNTYWWANQGLEMLGVKHCQKFRLI